MKAVLSKPAGRSPAGRSYEFGPFRLDTRERQLLREGVSVTLTPKAFDTLVALIESSGHVVGKDELMRAVWPDTYVEENTLTSNISTLRKALGQANGDQYIETVPKLGYRFVASVTELLDDDGALLIHRHTRTRAIIEERVTSSRSSFARLSAALRQPRTLMALAAFPILVLGLISYQLIATRSKSNAGRAGETANAVSRRRNEAVRSYAEGRALWNKRTAAALFESIGKYEQAIDADSTFALAYDGLADAYAFDLGHWRDAEALAQKAIELDSTLAEPHATLGFVHAFWQWNWNDAEQEFKKAIKLNPNYATVHQWYGIYLAVMLRTSEAEVEIARAAELEPQSPVMNADLGQVLYFAHKYDQAIAACNKALELDPGFFNAHQYLYQIYLEKQMYREGLNEFFTLSSLPGAATAEVTETNHKLRQTFESEGAIGFFRARLDHLLKHDPDPYDIAQCYMRLGARDRAMDWLERALEQHNFSLIYFRADPVFYDITQEPRVLRIDARMGLTGR